MDKITTRVWVQLDITHDVEMLKDGQTPKPRFEKLAQRLNWILEDPDNLGHANGEIAKIRVFEDPDIGEFQIPGYEDWEEDVIPQEDKA